MKFLGRAALAAAILGAGVLVVSMVIDTVESDRLWHQVKAR